MLSNNPASCRPKVKILACFFVMSFLLPVTGCKDKEDVPGTAVKDFNIDIVRRTWLQCSGSVQMPDYRHFLFTGLCWNKTGNPSLYDEFSIGLSSDTEIQSSAYGLEPATSYYIRWYTSDSAGVIYGPVSTVTTLPAAYTVAFNESLAYGSVKDVEGNSYKTIEIGNQTWMAENLKTTRLNDNTPIERVDLTSEWIGLHDPAYCWEENNEAVYKNLYGAFYNWYTVNTGKLCPTGWHVPTDHEWQVLEIELGMSAADTASYASRGSREALKIKESGNSNWFSDKNAPGSNETGFTALPAGFRLGYHSGIESLSGLAGGDGSIAFFWTSTPYYQLPVATCRWFYDISPVIWRDTREKTTGMSVRCLKD